MEAKIVVGSVVLSEQGYDKGKCYVVKEITNGFAYVMDGMKRHFHNPKKKNLKHLKSFSLVCVLEPNNVAKTNNEVHKLTKMFEKAMKNLIGG